MSIFETGIRPAVDEYLRKQAEEKRDYGDYWSASSAGYCMRKQIFERLKVPPTADDARKIRVFEVGDIFHEFMQRITKNAGLSIAQELELQDEDLMVRGHIDDLVMVEREFEPGEIIPVPEGVDEVAVLKIARKRLILYDYKTQNSRAFGYQKDRPMSHYHKHQVGSYLGMLIRLANGDKTIKALERDKDGNYTIDVTEKMKAALSIGLSEARILKISKDDLRMAENQLLWSPELEQEVQNYWIALNAYWRDKTLPKCTCADHEGGFLARKAYNPFYYNNEPCSIEWAKQQVDLSDWEIAE